MDNIKKLEELVKNDVLVEVDETIKELEDELARTKKKNDINDIKEELKYMEQIGQYFEEVLADIDNKSITQEQALDILEGLEDMRAENQEI